MDAVRNYFKNPFNDDLESNAEYKSRWISIHIMHFTMFLIALGFTIVLTGAWPYLDYLDPSTGKSFIGYVVSAMSIGQFLFAPILGKLADKINSCQMIIILTLIVYVISNAIYALVYLSPISSRKYVMLITRLLVGCSSANSVVLRSYISMATRMCERRKAMFTLNAAQVIGFIIGPSVQAICVAFGTVGFTIFGGVVINMYTSTIWLSVFLALLNIITLSPLCFKPSNIALKEIELNANTHGKSNKNIDFNKTAVYSLILSCFVMSFAFTMNETSSTAIIMDQFAFTNSEAVYFMGILLSIASTLSILTILLLNYLCKKFGEVDVMIFGGFFMMVLARGIYMPLGSEPAKTVDFDERLKVHEDIERCRVNNLVCNVTELVGCPLNQAWCATEGRMLISQFVIATLMNVLGYSISYSMIYTIYSKILNPKIQGTWMGYIVAATSAARILGPTTMMQLYTNFGPTITFGSTCFVLLLNMLWMIRISKQLTYNSLNQTQLIKNDDDC